eukprot:298401-Amphidinium_carterae.2
MFNAGAIPTPNCVIAITMRLAHCVESEMLLCQCCVNQGGNTPCSLDFGESWRWMLAKFGALVAISLATASAMTRHAFPPCPLLRVATRPVWEKLESLYVDDAPIDEEMDDQEHT